ncbi:MAG: hypothetical protein ABIN18_16120 [Pseudomonadota bacterium]
MKTKSPTDILKAMTKWLFAHLGKILFSLTVTATVLYLGGIYHVYETIWIYVKILFLSPMPLWATIALVFLLGVYVYIIISKPHSLYNLHQPKFFKYCPECDYGINAKRHEVFCSCGTKYLTKCPECNKKIIRDRSRICSFCGYSFPIKPRTGNEWMAR